MSARAAIVITNHNYERFVAAAIDSALAQTEPCEVVVVDDGSTDASLEVIEPHRDRVRIVTTANGGQAAAINAGFAVTGAPVVFFLDADDSLRPHAAERVLAALDAEPGAVRCQFRLGLIDAAGRPMPGGFPEPDRSLPVGDLRRRLTRAPEDISWQPTSGNAFRAETLHRLLPMPTAAYRISADHYLSNLSALHGPVASIETTLGHYRIHGDNADHRSAFDLARGRDILTRTEVTRRLLLEHGAALGVDLPATTSGFRSLSQSALRLASLRSEPRDDHPLPDDLQPGGLRRAIVAAVRSAAVGPERSPGQRVLAVGWVFALAVAPRRLVGRIAGLGLTR